VLAEARPMLWSDRRYTGACQGTLSCVAFMEVLTGGAVGWVHRREPLTFTVYLGPSTGFVGHAARGSGTEHAPADGGAVGGFEFAVANLRLHHHCQAGGSPSSSMGMAALSSARRVRCTWWGLHHVSEPRPARAGSRSSSAAMVQRPASSSGHAPRAADLHELEKLAGWISMYRACMCACLPGQPSAIVRDDDPYMSTRVCSSAADRDTRRSSAPRGHSPSARTEQRTRYCSRLVRSLAYSTHVVIINGSELATAGRASKRGHAGSLAMFAANILIVISPAGEVHETGPCRLVFGGARPTSSSDLSGSAYTTPL
jgi:hypothetical protein